MVEKALLAIQCWRNQDFGLEITSHAAVDALLDAVFAKAPNHPAHHYRVHLWDGEKAERALRSAAAIGDDKLQQASQGVVVPDSFTHGSSAQRTKWFNVGFQSGSMQRCDTFRNPV